MANLIIVFGDQLNTTISSLTDINKQHDHILLCEVRHETDFVPHHRLKIAFLFSAMRHFAQELTQQGYNVEYVKLDDPDNTQSFSKEAQRFYKQLNPKKIILTEPSEYRVLVMVKTWSSWANCEIEVREDTRFYTTHAEFEQFAAERKQLRMETFYQRMRKKYNILMQNNKPEGGQWNYDSQNRKRLPKNIKLPHPTQFTPDPTTEEVITLVNDNFSNHPGSTNNFYFATTRKQALQVLQHFLAERLTQFGDYQDAMTTIDPWLFHSHISFYINCGLLLAKEVVDAALEHYHSYQAPLNAIEGFIRQVIGWREFVRGVYWLKMPDYYHSNYFKSKRPLPEIYWNGKTTMNCLKHCISNTLDNAYAHHIQRLMVLGNFALLMQCDPAQVQAWYLAIYADAYEWVEMPNVVGMIMHADGGVLASKPYIASGNYINKMSDYCKDCQFNVKEKTGASACPFNYLYWNFLIEQKDKLQGNPRLAFPYRNLAKMTEEQQKNITDSAEQFISNKKYQAE